MGGRQRKQRAKHRQQSLMTCLSVAIINNSFQLDTYCEACGEFLGGLTNLCEDCQAEADDKQAREEEFEAHCRLRDRKLTCCDVVRKALGDRWEPLADGYGGFGSIYMLYRSRSRYGWTVEIRISDHEQVAGGGYNPDRDDRNGESDISFVIDSENCQLPTVQEVRRLIANSLRMQK